MMDSDKIVGAATGLAGQAGELAEQVRTKVGSVASDVAGRAIPLAGQAAATASELADKVGAAAAQGLDAVAGTLNAVTGGRAAEHIGTVTSKLKDVLDPAAKG